MIESEITTRVVGRDAALRAAEDLAASVAGGEGRVLALLGEAGLGKSTLLAAVHAASERHGLRVLEGRAAEHERDVPFGLVIDALDRAVAGMNPRRLEALGEHHAAGIAAVLPSAGVPGGDGAGTAGERFRLHRALHALLEMLGRERPVALLLDDVHWADEASLELLSHLLRRPPAGPHLLAIAMRPGEAAPRLLDALRAVPAARIERLAPLGDEDALALVGDLDGAVGRRVVREAGGNPLFLRELARAARESPGRAALPPTLVAAVQREVAGLPPASRALIEGAAIAGDPFDPELAAAAAELDPADALAPLDRLVASGLIAEAEGPRRFAFRHPLVRRAVEEAAPAGWQLAAHERVAEALAARGAGPAARAYHVERFARPGDGTAIDLLEAAADGSRATSPAGAARWYRAALGLLPAGDAGRRIGLGTKAALALADAGRLEESRAALLDALELLPPDAGAERVALIAACAEVEHVLGRHAEAQARLERVHGALGHGSPDGARARIEFQLAVGASLYGTGGDVVTAWARRAQRSAGPDDAALTTAADALAAVGALRAGRTAEARAALGEADRGLRGLDLTAPGARDAAVNVAYALLLHERYADAVDTAAAGLRAARAAREDRFVVPLTLVRAMGLWNGGRLDEALELLTAGEDAARLQDLRYPLVWTLWQRAQILDLQGDRVGARQADAEYRALAGTLEPSGMTATGLCNLATLWVDDEPERTLREMEAAGGPELERVEPAWSPFLLRATTLAALAAGRRDDAVRWAGIAEARAAALDLPVARARAETARAAVVLHDGDAMAAAALARDAARTAEAAGAPLDAIVAQLVAADALAAADRREDAIAVLRGTANAAAGLGAVRFHDAAARRLRRLGARASAVVRASDGTLTDREREVAELVARGRSNKEVGAALLLSHKSVEHTLSRVYAKLGVRSRTELAALLSRGGQRDA